MSHTVRVKIELRNQEALARAVVALGGRVLGRGTHRLYSSQESGFAVQLPGWKYPVVVRGDGTVAYDNYNGAWGNARDLDALRAHYAIEAARAECERLGWYCEEVSGGLVIYHPDGGTLTISATGEVDASGFIGGSCAEASAPIEAALGRRVEAMQKPEFYHEQAHVACKEQ